MVDSDLGIGRLCPSDSAVCGHGIIIRTFFGSTVGIQYFRTFCAFERDKYVEGDSRRQ